MRFTDRWTVAASVACAAALAACSSPRSPPPEPGAALPVPGPSASRARNWDDYRMQAGRRLVAANPNASYTGAPPDPLLAIPVLDIELNADGSVRRVNVQRTPTQATDTVQTAIDAVHRAGPFGDVSHLPRPWRFSEVFLFRDDRKFKPRSLE